MWKNYFSVTSLDEAIELLARFDQQARVVAGGTDLLIELDRQQRSGVDTLIDITRVPGLNGIHLQDGHIHIGPLVTHNQAVASEVIQNHAFPLAQACWEVGAPQIRNRATIAGNVITASPANDTISPLWALGAKVTLRSTQGERILSFPEFYRGVRKTAMRPDELLTDIQFPMMQPNQQGIFLRNVLRRAQAISVINVTVILTFAEDDLHIEAAQITLGSVAPIIIRVLAAEDFLRDQVLTDAVITEAARIASGVPTPIDDVRAPAAYRTEMVRVWTARALRHLRDRTHTATFPQNPAMLWGDTRGIFPNNLPLSVRHERDAGDTIVTTVNGQVYSKTGGSHKTLLDFLREDLHLTGTKEGCAEGECGACTVILDGITVMACMVPAPRAHGAQVVTVEGLAQDGSLHPIQRAFVETGAVQCGFCTPGFLMSGVALLHEHPQPADEQIKQSISGNLCRCTGYYKIIDAFQQASRQHDVSGV